MSNASTLAAFSSCLTASKPYGFRVQSSDQCHFSLFLTYYQFGQTGKLMFILKMVKRYWSEITRSYSPTIRRWLNSSKSGVVAKRSAISLFPQARSEMGFRTLRETHSSHHWGIHKFSKVKRRHLKDYQSQQHQKKCNGVLIHPSSISMFSNHQNKFH